MPRAWPTAEDQKAARANRRARAGPSFIALRLANMYRLFADRYGATLPDDDAGRDDLALLLHHFVGTRDEEQRMASAANAWAPWLSAVERSEIIERVLRKPLRFKADTIARLLGVTAADRIRLKLWTIGAVDETSDQRRAARKERARLARQAKRRAAGAKPLAEFRAEQRARPKPWIAAGVSRRTWQRRHGPSSQAA